MLRKRCQLLGLSLGFVGLSVVTSQTVPSIAPVLAASVGAPTLVNPSNQGGYTETTVASDPSNSQNLFVGSNQGDCSPIGNLQPIQGFLSTDSGLSWSHTSSPPITGNGALDPAPAFDSAGALYYGYLDINCTLSRGNLVVAKSTDKGTTWGSPATIDSFASNPYHPDKPMMLVDTTSGSPFNNRPYIVYSRVPDPSGQQPLELSYFNGTSWSNPPTTVDGGIDIGGALAVGPSSGKLYASWWDFSTGAIRIAASTNGGASFSAATTVASTSLLGQFYQLPSYTGNGIADNPSLGVDRTGGFSNGNLYLVWNDTLAPPAVAPTANATTGGVLPPGTYLAAYTYMTSFGETATSPVASITLTSGQNAIQIPGLSGVPTNVTGVRYYLVGVPSGSGIATGFVGSGAVSGGTAAGVFIGGGSGNQQPPPKGTMHIFFSRSTDSGAHWSTRVRLDVGNPNDAWEPTLSVDQSNGRVAVAWYDRRDDPGNGLYRVYYSQSADGGSTFPAQQTAVSSSPGDPTANPYEGTGDYMGIASLNGSAHPVWVESHTIPNVSGPIMQVWTATVNEQPSAPWNPQPGSPGVRWQGGLVYHAGLGEALMYGGGDQTGFYSDTEVWNMGWGAIFGTGPAGDEKGPAMAYDAARGTTVLFGGFATDVNGTPIFFNDTYTFDGTVWTKRTPVTSPSPRAYSSMAYDEARGLVVLFGGLDAKGAVMGDTWTWDGTNWSKRTMKGPAGRSGGAMTYDPLRGRTVLFGGQGSRKCQTFGDTWTWDGGSWTPLSPMPSPSPRYGSGLAYDAMTGTSILFGGESCQQNNLADLNDTWSWTGSSWAPLNPANPPSPRHYFQMTYDAATTTLLLFGGGNVNGTTIYGDTWTY